MTTQTELPTKIEKTKTETHAKRKCLRCGCFREMENENFCIDCWEYLNKDEN